MPEPGSRAAPRRAGSEPSPRARGAGVPASTGGGPGSCPLPGPQPHPGLHLHSPQPLLSTQLDWTDGWLLSCPGCSPCPARPRPSRGRGHGGASICTRLTGPWARGAAGSSTRPGGRASTHPPPTSQAAPASARRIGLSPGVCVPRAALCSALPWLRRPPPLPAAQPRPEQVCGPSPPGHLLNLAPAHLLGRRRACRSKGTEAGPCLGTGRTWRGPV